MNYCKKIGPKLTLSDDIIKEIRGKSGSWKFELIKQVFWSFKVWSAWSKIEKSRDTNRIGLSKIGANRVCHSKRIWSSTNWSMNNGTGSSTERSSERSRTVHRDLSAKLSCRLTGSRRFTARSTEKLFQRRLGLLIFKGIRRGSKRIEYI